MTYNVFGGMLSLTQSINFEEVCCNCEYWLVCSFTEFVYVLQRKSGEVRAQRSQLKQIEDLSAGLEERLILDNR